MMNNKLSAFTIIEVTVVMLLTAITIAITYNAYRMVSNSYFKFDEKNKKIAEFLLMDKLFKKDIDFAHLINRTENGLQLKNINGNITYDFKPEYIIRNQYQLRNDTFFVKNANLYMTYENEPIEVDKRVDELTFSADIMKTTSQLHYKKTYSSDELMNAENEHP